MILLEASLVLQRMGYARSTTIYDDMMMDEMGGVMNSFTLSTGWIGIITTLPILVRI